MKPRLQALRALRLNYKRRGVYVWLKRRTCWGCGGKGKVLHGNPLPIVAGRPVVPATCSCCHGNPKRGYQRILSEPDRVTQEQHAIAEGVMG